MISNPASGRVRLDPVAELFLRLENHVNVHSNQLLVVGGRLDLERLTRAVHDTVARFPILTAAPIPPGWATLNHFRPQDVPVAGLGFEGAPIDFGEPAFRRFIMNHSHVGLSWGLQPPVRVALVHDAEGRRSAVLLQTSHAVADAASDSFLFAAIASRYGALATTANDRPEAPPPTVHPATTLRDVRPDLFGAGRGFWLRARGAASKIAMAWRADTSLPMRQDAPSPTRAHVDRWGPLDFHQTVFDEEETARLKSAARRGGATINTVLLAVLARAVDELAGRDARGDAVRVTLPLGCRPAPRPGATPADFVFGNFALACNVRVPRARSTRALLEAIAAEVAAQRATGHRHEFGALQFLLPFLRRRGSPFSSRFAWRALGTNVFFSNPGVIAEPFDCFGDASLPILEYAGMSCVLPPYVVSLFTPQVRGRLHLNVLFRPESLVGGIAPLVEAWTRHLQSIVAELLGEQTEKQS